MICPYKASKLGLEIFDLQFYAIDEQLYTRFLNDNIEVLEAYVIERLMPYIEGHDELPIDLDHLWNHYLANFRTMSELNKHIWDLAWQHPKLGHVFDFAIDIALLSRRYGTCCVTS